MIVCPVCDHAQAQGAECEVCGKRLLHGAAAAEADAYVPPAEGLEPTRHAPVDADEAPVPDLEPTRLRDVDAPAEPPLDLETGRADPVEVAPESVPDLERADQAIPGDAPTAVPAAVLCRYCRTPGVPGERVCSRCGMRLPVFDASPSAPTAEAASRVCGCGAPVTGSRCASCGARHS